MKFWEPLYNFLKSIKLAIVLIMYLAVTSALSTLVPQGKEIAFYYQNYSSWMANLIIKAHFNRFFQSVFFIFPVIIFFLNLLTCAVVRLVKRLKNRAKKRFGPDIIHIGLLILIIGGILGSFGRQENMVFLGEGDSAQLPGGYTIQLKSFKFLKYEDGRPKDWLSDVDVLKDGVVIKSHIIEVNKPLKLGKIKVFQNSYNTDSTATVSDRSGKTIEIRPGDYYMARDAVIVFRGIELNPTSGGKDRDPSHSDTEENGVAPSENGVAPSEHGVAVFEELSTGNEDAGHSIKAVYRLSISEEIDGFTMEKFSVLNQTGLQVVKDPSIALVLIALILVGSGLSLTFIQKFMAKNI